MKIQYILAILLLSVVGWSCSDITDINDNSNDSTDELFVALKPRLSVAIRKGSTYGGADVHQRIKALSVDAFVQYTGGSSSSRVWSPNDGWQIKYWDAHYFEWMYPTNSVIDYIRNSEDSTKNINILSTAKTWRVYLQSQFTDYYGPAAFPKSIYDKGLQYEPLEKQYEFFFSELDNAVKSYGKGGHLSYEDEIYSGDTLKWKRFANSLRLRLAIKMSEIDPELCKTQAQAAFNASGGLLEEGDDAGIGSTSGWGQQYPYYMYQVGWSERQVMVSSMEKILTDIGGIAYKDTAALEYPAVVDPRGLKYFDPSPRYTDANDNTKVVGGIWKGLIPGQRTEDGDIRKHVAAMSTRYVIPNDTKKTDVFLYSEVCFLMAEAVERGFVTGAGTAKDWYEKGVRASFAKWQAKDVDTYLASTAKNKYGTSANYDDATGAGNTKLEKIITQKYISHYVDLSVQSWNDKRRLNLPAMDIPEYRDPGAGTYPSDGDVKNPRNYVSRALYPQNENILNKNAYQAGVAQLEHGDKTSSALWWASKRANYCTSQ